jgi:hypothetical protein
VRYLHGVESCVCIYRKMAMWYGTHTGVSTFFLREV